ncbi:MAG: hypothetical protein A3G38_00700 [Omnitrophica WOR_2 bacterium RIFCSPLOWO2_12_FULL_51_8]|nr:MAG: hypothetical protein A3G38_00700 [Omnitrophica WOR_2 bacterium RIFCSPLOWO2_12_FULL_51_8]
MKIFSKIKNKAGKEKFSVGLDIGTASVKMAKLKLSENIPELCAFCLEPSQLDLAGVLKKLKSTYSLETVNISFTGPSTVTRYVNMPKMDYAEFKQALKFEAQKYIPFSASEVNLDGCILRDNLPDNKMLVLIAAVKKEAVEQRLKLLQEAGLSARAIDIDAVAITNGFSFTLAQDASLKQKACALLDIGASVASLAVLECGALVLSRDIHIAGNAITQKIMDIFGVDFKAAELLKIRPGAQDAAKLNAALESVMASLAGEIRTSFDYYESQSASTVSGIFLSGGAADFAGLKDNLANFLGIEVVPRDPLKGLRLAANIAPEALKGISGKLAVAMGLALRS